MSSQRKIESARANGARSKGANTPEGRRKSALNALRHGLTARTLVLSNESPERFDDLRAAYRRHFSPEGEVEADLVEQLVASRWRQSRYWTVETALFDAEMDEQEPEIRKKFESIDEQTRLALAFKSLADESCSLALLNRYEARHRRAYERALKSLMAIQADRKPASDPATPPEKQKLPIEPNPKNGHSPEPALTPPQVTVPVALPPEENFGTATMQADGAILLELQGGAPGRPLLYPKGHPDYDAVLRGLGGLKPGESKPVPVRPQQEADENR